MLGWFAFTLGGVLSAYLLLRPSNVRLSEAAPGGQ